MTATVPTRRLPQAGPPLPPVAIVTVALFLTSLVLPLALTGGATYPSPFGPHARPTAPAGR